MLCLAFSTKTFFSLIIPIANSSFFPTNQRFAVGRARAVVPDVGDVVHDLREAVVAKVVAHEAVLVLLLLAAAFVRVGRGRNGVVPRGAVAAGASKLKEALELRNFFFPIVFSSRFPPFFYLASCLAVVSQVSHLPLAREEASAGLNVQVGQGRVRPVNELWEKRENCGFPPLHSHLSTNGLTVSEVRCPGRTGRFFPRKRNEVDCN